MTERPGIVLLAETALLLARASLRLRTRDFADIVEDIASGASRPACPAPRAALLGRALDAWERRVPWRWKCFEKGLAAHWWLARRGFASTLHYGALDDGELKAHVWVTSGSAPVVGCEQAGQFVELRRFS